jgi:hypothetical protein
MYEHGTVKPVEVILRMGKGKKKNNGGDETTESECTECMYRNVKMKPPVQLLHTNKNIEKYITHICKHTDYELK